MSQGRIRPIALRISRCPEPAHFPFGSQSYAAPRPHPPLGVAKGF